jgi:hypothetical protein
MPEGGKRSRNSMMVKFVEVDPADVPTERLGRRGRVSYPIIKGFMETNYRVAKIDITGLGKNPAYLRSVLTAYINSHSLPIKLFAAGGDLHLMRLDMDDEGNVIPNWKPDMATTEGNVGAERDIEAVPITPEEVEARSAQATDTTV